MTNFKGPRKKFDTLKVRYVEIHYIKSINQQNPLNRDLKETSSSTDNSFFPTTFSVSFINRKVSIISVSKL